jgi:REP element-mobilizing transposase RayT
MDEDEEPRGQYSRGYLPHIDVGSQPQFLTWRLEDSIPAELITKWRNELDQEEEKERRKKLYSQIEKYLDQGHGSCVLKNPVAARIVQDALLFHHETQYQLHEWCVMPNHVHVLLTPFEGVTLEQVTHSQKSFTSSQIHKHLGGGRGKLWQIESFDRFIRDQKHFESVALYIRRNPVRAKLVADYTLWPYGSGNPIAMKRVLEKSSLKA